jgi:hypothetical protein
MRVLLARAVQPLCAKVAEAEFLRRQRMLAGEDQRRGDPLLS